MQTHHTSSEGQYEINEKRAEDRNTRATSKLSDKFHLFSVSEQ